MPRAIVMKYYPINLSSYLKSSSEIVALGIIKNMALDIIRGLSHIHSCGIIHFDLKPLNVLLDDSLRCAISDFGASHYSINSFNLQ
jgi:serine/threonine protein kinase